MEGRERWREGQLLLILEEKMWSGGQLPRVGAGGEIEITEREQGEID
jgi:hypothetical protein